MLSINLLLDVGMKFFRENTFLISKWVHFKHPVREGKNSEESQNIKIELGNTPSKISPGPDYRKKCVPKCPTAIDFHIPDIFNA